MKRLHATIIAAAQKFKTKTFQEDPKLLMWYDQVLAKTGEEQLWQK